MNENPAKPNSNETDLLELALRLAMSPSDSNIQNAQLLPGQLPDQLPVDLPFPEGNRVLGSLIRNPESITILLDVHLSPEHVLTFYKQRMQAAGWQTTDMYPPHRRGFMPSRSRSRGGNETFYQDPHDPALTVSTLGSSSSWDDDKPYRRGPVLTVNAFPGRDNGTDLRLNLEMNSPLLPGSVPHRGRHPSRNLFSFLPAVEAPEGTNQRGGGHGSSLNSAYSDATLETHADLSTLAAHYKTQLEQAGCVLTAEGQQGPIAWKTWIVREDDEQCHGFLIILKVLDQEYYLTMRMRSDNRSKAPTER